MTTQERKPCVLETCKIFNASEIDDEVRTDQILFGIYRLHVTKYKFAEPNRFRVQIANTGSYIRGASILYSTLLCANTLKREYTLTVGTLDVQGDKLSYAR